MPTTASRFESTDDDVRTLRKIETPRDVDAELARAEAYLAELEAASEEPPAEPAPKTEPEPTRKTG